MNRSDVSLPAQAAVQCFLCFPFTRPAVQADLSTARGEASCFLRLKCYQKKYSHWLDFSGQEEYAVSKG